MAHTENKRTLTGVVVSDKMEKSVVVSVERQFPHRKYSKQMKRSAKFKAHDETNIAKVGDRVLIEECRPLSKDKHWLLKSVIEKAVQ